MKAILAIFVLSSSNLWTLEERQYPDMKACVSAMSALTAPRNPAPGSKRGWFYPFCYQLNDRVVAAASGGTRPLYDGVLWERDGVWRQIGNVATGTPCESVPIRRTTVAYFYTTAADGKRGLSVCTEKGATA